MPAKSSHFLAFPLYTNPELRRHVRDFQAQLLGDAKHIEGLDKTIFMDPWRLHMTVGMVGLVDEVGARAGAPTVTSALNLLQSLSGEITKILDGRKLEVALDKLDITQAEGSSSAQFAHVLYAGPVEDRPDMRLRQVMDLVYNEFKRNGYISENRSPRIHCTLMNTKYRKPKQKIPFSYADVLDSPACDVLGMERLGKKDAKKAGTARRIGRLGAVGLNEIELWKMGSHAGGDRDTYISVGAIPLVWDVPKPSRPEGRPNPPQQVVSQSFQVHAPPPSALIPPLQPVPLVQKQAQSYQTHQPASGALIPPLQPVPLVQKQAQSHQTHQQPSGALNATPQQVQATSYQAYQPPPGALNATPSGSSTYTYQSVGGGGSNPIAYNPTYKPTETSGFNIANYASPLQRPRRNSEGISFSSKPKVMCVQCRSRPVYQSQFFCSRECTSAAATRRIFLLPADHPKYNDVRRSFEDSWDDRGRPPRVRQIAAVVCDNVEQSRFENYVKRIEAGGRFQGRMNKAGNPMRPGNEKHLYHGMVRTCDIGEKTLKTCEWADCYLCGVLESGFGGAMREGNWQGSGITQVLASRSSSKVVMDGRAGNRDVKVVAACRAIVGRPFDTSDPMVYPHPPAGYDSIYGKSEKEFVVYDKHAIQIRYLIFFSLHT